MKSNNSGLYVGRLISFCGLFGAITVCLLSCRDYKAEKQKFFDQVFFKERATNGYDSISKMNLDTTADFELLDKIRNLKKSKAKADSLMSEIKQKQQLIRIKDSLLNEAWANATNKTREYFEYGN